MIKATKATKKRLSNHSGNRFVRACTLLETIIAEAERYERNEHPDAWAFYTPECLYCKAYETDKPPLRGLHSLFPRMIEVSFTHGLNEVRILDINKLVKAMLNDEEIAP